jgi:hypothetical protein
VITPLVELLDPFFQMAEPFSTFGDRQQKQAAIGRE